MAEWLVYYGTRAIVIHSSHHFCRDSNWVNSNGIQTIKRLNAGYCATRGSQKNGVCKSN